MILMILLNRLEVQRASQWDGTILFVCLVQHLCIKLPSTFSHSLAQEESLHLLCKHALKHHREKKKKATICKRSKTTYSCLYRMAQR